MKPRKILARHAAWVMVVRENPSEYEKTVAYAQAASSRGIFELVRERILAEPAEVLYALALDGQNRVMALCEVSRGGLHGCAVAARDILRPMLMSGASAIVLVHNHPSGDPTPSHEDVALTIAVAKAADVVGCPVVDHVIVAGYERYTSMRDMGLVDP